mmetsp:Transcript_40143/g.84311  ORF Transcript_40143/g.84311 Transcript_40143/m.84311 type:complete len:299 (+) Transcript_40143:69-965(+)
MSTQNAPLVTAAASTVLLGMAYIFSQRNNTNTSRREEDKEEATISANNSDADSLPSIVGSDDDGDILSDQSTGSTAATIANDDANDLSVLPCIQDRRSVFPNAFKKNPPPLDESIIRSLLDAALYGPFHGKCYAGNKHPAKFVVLGKESMIEMQHLTLEYYDKHWKELGSWASQGEYDAFRKCTEDEITGRWGPVSYMIGIVVRRQSGPKRFPQWEESSAVACAVQNMHIQSTKFKELACYWSSWHDAARDSNEMKEFLGMGEEDACFGFFIVAHAKNPDFRPRRRRDRSLVDVEWRS